MRLGISEVSRKIVRASKKGPNSGFLESCLPQPNVALNKKVLALHLLQWRYRSSSIYLAPPQFLGSWHHEIISLSPQAGHIVLNKYFVTFKWNWNI